MSYPTVLVLDDDWDICDAVEDVLSESGFTVVSMPNGALGLEHLHAHPPPAAILLDLMMPTMNGWTFVDRMRAVPKLSEIPIIAMTAAGPHWGYPVSRVLRKPVQRHELLAAIREVVYGRVATAPKV